MKHVIWVVGIGLLLGGAFYGIQTVAEMAASLAAAAT